MAEEVKVSKQWTVQLFEVVKAAAVAGFTAAASIIYLSIQAQHLPTISDLKSAGMFGLLAFVGAVVRYFVNPTQTTIKGAIDPNESVIVTKPKE